MEPLVQELKAILDRIRQTGQRMFVYDDDGMRYLPVVARTEEEARRKVLAGRDDEEWDENHQALIEINGDPI